LNNLTHICIIPFIIVRRLDDIDVIIGRVSRLLATWETSE
jgi:hypothetical protein